MYQVEHNELFAGIRSGKPINNGPYMAHSTMMGIMGRMAAYTGKKITWDHAMQSKENLTPPAYKWGPIEVAPVAMPGITPVQERRVDSHRRSHKPTAGTKPFRG